MFLDKLDATLLDSTAGDYRGLWRLNKPLRFVSYTLGRVITVPAGFISDLESCPRLPLVFLAFGNVTKAGAVAHDYLYTWPAKCTRAEADAVLREACLAEGVSTWRAWGIWAGVRIGGRKSFAKPAKKHGIPAD